MLDLLKEQQMEKDKENALSQSQNYEFKHILDFEIKIKNQMICRHNNIADYISSNKKKLLGNSLYSQLISLLNKIEMINNEHINKSIVDIIIELNSNEEVINIKKRLYVFATQYCEHRAKKYNNKDKNFIIDKLLRISMELIPNITCIIFIENGLFLYFLKDFYLYLAMKLESCVKIEECRRANIKKSKYDLSIFKLSNSSSIADLFRKIEYFDPYDITISNEDMIDECKLIIEDIIKWKHYIANKTEKIDILNNGNYIECNWEYKNNNILRFPQLNISINHDGIAVDSDYSFLNTNTYYDAMQNDICYRLNYSILINIHNYFHNIIKDVNINEIENELVLEQNNQPSSNSNQVIDNNKVLTKKHKIKQFKQFTTKKLKDYIHSIGFIEISRTGSHIKYRNDKSNKTCTFADKKNTYSYKLGSLKKILKDYNKTLDDLQVFYLKYK